MSTNPMTSPARASGHLLQHSRSTIAFYGRGYGGKAPPHCSANQIIQFDNPSPGHGMDGHGSVTRKPEALDFSRPSFKDQTISGSALNQPLSLSASQKISDHFLPMGIMTSDHEDDVSTMHRDSPPWYTDVTSMITSEPQLQPSVPSNAHEADRGYYTSVFDPQLNTGVIKYNSSPVPGSLTPLSLYAQSTELPYGDSPFPQPLKREVESPIHLNNSVTRGPLERSFPHNENYESDPLKDISFSSCNGLYPGNNQPCGSIGGPDHKGMNGNTMDSLDFHSGSNSVDSMLSCEDNGARFNDSEFSDHNHPLFARHSDSGRSQSHQQQYQQQYHQQHQQQQQHHHANVLDRDSQPVVYHRDTASTSSSVSSLSPSSTSTSQPSSQVMFPSPGDAMPRAMSTGSVQEPRNDQINGDNSQTLKGRQGGKSRGAQNLPPCRVCGNKASGLHFGVNTCEACNEFFRRSLKRGATYYCTKSRECQVYGKKRNACSYCRYHRCVEMGMSRDAIKTGRYSHKTRTEYAIEVEEFKQREMNRVEKEKYEVLLYDLVTYHDKYVNATTRVPGDDLQKSQHAYLLLYQTQREHELRHPPLSSTMQNKGLVNGWRTDKEDLTLTMHDVEMTERWLRNYINFAKNVPGFKELALSDQASLVRGSWFEFWFLGAYRGYNSKIRVVIYPNRRCFHEEEIKQVFGEEYCDFSFYLSDRMRMLNVSPEEMVLIKTVCLTFPDRTTLENKEAVERMHWLMVSCLLHTLEKNRPGDRTIFPLIVSKLVELRTLTEIAMRAHRRAVFQDVLKDSPLLCEMVDTKTTYVRCVVHNNSPHPPKCSAAEVP